MKKNQEIEFYTHSNIETRIKYKGIIEYSEQMGYIVNVSGVTYELKKLIII